MSLLAGIKVACCYDSEMDKALLKVVKCFTTSQPGLKLGFEATFFHWPKNSSLGQVQASLSLLAINLTTPKKAIFHRF